MVSPVRAALLLVAFSGGCAGVLGIEEGTLASGTHAPDAAGADAAGADAAGVDAAGVDAARGAGPASCALPGAGRSDCGATGESCCSSLRITGGSFSRSYDGVEVDAGDGDPRGYIDPKYKATVADFRLDKYEITVGRFRRFVDAASSGWRPPAGSGKHSHVNGGSGLRAAYGFSEPGWNIAWNENLPSNWAVAFICDTSPSWTPAPGPNERRPIGCLSWYAALAFCIWDDGFLPSEAEWNYAAAGGSEQRVYPWSNPASDTTVSAGHAVYLEGSTNPQDVGSRSPLGDGRYGHADLAGNVAEWVLDEHAPLQEECVKDCANFPYLNPNLPPQGVQNRVVRGGSFKDPPAGLVASSRVEGVRVGDFMGARCARTP